MEHKELTAQLRRMSVETGSLMCLGCGYEHNCGIHGCALLRQVVKTIERQAAAIEELRDHECSGLIEEIVQGAPQMTPEYRQNLEHGIQKLDKAVSQIMEE